MMGNVQESVKDLTARPTLTSPRAPGRKSPQRSDSDGTDGTDSADRGRGQRGAARLQAPARGVRATSLSELRAAPGESPEARARPVDNATAIAETIRA